MGNDALSPAHRQGPVVSGRPGPTCFTHHRNASAIHQDRHDEVVQPCDVSFLEIGRVDPKSEELSLDDAASLRVVGYASIADHPVLLSNARPRSTNAKDANRPKKAPAR